MDENKEFFLALFTVLVYLVGGFLLNIKINKKIETIENNNLPDGEKKKKKIKSYRKKLLKYSFYLMALVLMLYYFLHSIFFKK